MTKYIFIDESGDPGNVLVDGASSKHYAELALQLDGDDSLDDFIAHIVSWKYISGKLKEIKPLPRGDQCRRYLAPIVELYEQGKLNCSCVYLLKEQYNGPYLKQESPRGYNPLYFRNFIHKELLKHHFTEYPVSTETRIYLIFDDYSMNFEDIRNTEDYLQNNWNLPDFWRITHTDSISNIALQVVSQLIGAIKDIAIGDIDEKKRQLLSFIALKDITHLLS